MKRIISYASACLLAAIYASSAQAMLIGGPSIIAAPASVIDDPPGHTNSAQDAFDEQQGVLLSALLSVDGGTIGPNITVDSHMILLNTASGSATDTATWTFDGLILGVMSDSGGTLEAMSTHLLGATSTLYPTTGGGNVGGLPGTAVTFAGFGARGLEGGDSYLVSGNSIRVTMSVSEPGDWIRVITQTVPEPASLVLMGLGLLGFGYAGARRAAQ